MTRSAARTGDVSAQASSRTAHPEAGAGQWQAGPIIETAHERITADGAPVLQEATCLFTFAGNTGAATSTVTLTAAGTLLRGSAGGVLLDADANQDCHGNRLEVQTRQPRLRTTV